MADILGLFISGANGRMGKSIIRLVAEDAALKLFGASEASNSPVQGADAGINAGTRLLSVSITTNLVRALGKHKGVIIDFSSVDATLDNINHAIESKHPLVIGTTSFNAEQLLFIKGAATKVPIMMSPNMSVGVNVLFQSVPQMAKALSEGYDIEVLEAHHHLKVDAPSGTAMKLAEKLCQATSREFPKDLKFHREGVPGKRSKREIGMQSLRGGDIVGEHTVFFYGSGERIEIKHVATDRTTFAVGAIRAAKWLKDKSPGLYDMLDVLGLKG